MTTTTVRRATIADRGSLRFVLADGSRINNDIILWFDKPEVTTYVAECDGRVVGQVMTDDAPRPDGRPADDNRRFRRLFFLHVDRDYRRRGIGAALMSCVEGDAVAAGVDGVLLMVEVVLPDVRAMYERRGYAWYADSNYEGVTDDGRVFNTPNVAMWLQLEANHAASVSG